MEASEYNYLKSSGPGPRQMFCWHFSNLCTTASLVDNKPHFLQPCQIVCTVSWEQVQHSEWKNVKVVGTFTCCSCFELLMMTCSLIYSHNISWFCLCDWSYFSVKGNYASSTRRANIFAISAIIITQATKFVAMLRTLNRNTKIHTYGRIFFFFVGKDMLQSRFERDFLENGSLIC